MHEAQPRARARPDAAPERALSNIVTADYFRTMGIPLRAALVLGTAAIVLCIGYLIFVLVAYAVGKAQCTWSKFAIAGVPFAAMLTAVMFMLALAQIGPFPVFLGALVQAH